MLKRMLCGKATGDVVHIEGQWKLGLIPVQPMFAQHFPGAVSKLA